jgi:23S rRNA pseudouridine1911/1915/1917 synthase
MRWLTDAVSSGAQGPGAPREVVRPPGVAEDCVVRMFRVPPEGAGIRLDVFLSNSLRNTSRTRAKLIAERSAYAPDGRALKASERLRAEDHVVLWRPPVDDVDPELELPRVHEDPHLWALNKPPNLTVHPTARHYKATVTKMLAAAHPGQHLGLIHRIDRETSGVLLVARSAAAERAFKRAFEGLPPLGEPRRRSSDSDAPRARRIEKIYLAVCWGTPPDGLVDRPLQADLDNPLRVKMRVAPPGTGLSAQTELQTLDRCAGYSLVRCSLLTGRQHQIRVHLASLGCAVVGDKLYGPDDRLLARAADGELTDEDLVRLELPRHALHAARYRMEHAVTGGPLDVFAPLAPDLVEFWKKVSGREPPAEALASAASS